MKTTLKTSIAAVALFSAFGLSTFPASAQHREYRKNENRHTHRAVSHENRYASTYDRNDRCRAEYAYPASTRFDDARYVYQHPRYGTVYRRFHSAPFRMHGTTGDLYYRSGLYYRYYPKVGYVRVQLPVNVVFVDLPGDYTRVFIDGGWYFRVGDQYFERHGEGYRLSTHFSVNLSARF